MKTPYWAITLITQIVTHYQVPFPVVVFRKHTNPHSYSGLTYHQRERGIVIRVGSKLERWKQKKVLLHELAHWIMPRKQGHSVEFWKLAFVLYQQHHIPLYKALHNERLYRRSAEIAYREIKGLRKKSIRRKIAKTSLRVLYKYHYPYLGIARTSAAAWAVISVDDTGKSWTGIRITKKLFTSLKAKHWTVIHEPAEQHP